MIPVSNRFRQELNAPMSGRLRRKLFAPAHKKVVPGSDKAYVWDVAPGTNGACVWEIALGTDGLDRANGDSPIVERRAICMLDALGSIIKNIGLSGGVGKLPCQWKRVFVVLV